MLFQMPVLRFSKGKLAENLRGRPYDLSEEEIGRRTKEAWARGATEVCMQGGIHPEYTGDTYVNILKTVKKPFQTFTSMRFHHLKSGKAQQPWR